MSDDMFTEVTKESWFGRIGGALKGILVGLVLFSAAFPLLFWNEGRSIKRYKTLKEGAGIVTSVAAEKIDPGNNGRLVHVSGLATTEEILCDQEFGISENALKLKRIVEMYQWEEETKSEEQKKVGGGTETVKTYTYKKGWHSDLIDSGSFKKHEGHVNPQSMPYSSTELVANRITVGAFVLPGSLVAEINDYSSFLVDSTKEAPDTINKSVKSDSGGYYIGDNPSEPQVGDIKVSFKIIKPTDVSVIARQISGTFEPYPTKSGGSIELLQIGNYSPDAMFQKAHTSNTIMTWLIRLGGFVLMFIGLSMALKPLSVIADVLPILGDIIGAGTGIIALLLTGALSAVTISIAWIFYRPVIGIILLLFSGALIWAIKVKVSRAKGVG